MPFLFILILMNLFYAGTPAFMKLAASGLHPFHIVFLRHTLALLAFLPFFLLQPKKKIDRNDFFQIMLGSFLAFTFASIFQIVGMQYSNAADGTFIMAMEPIIVIALAYFFLKERLDSKIFGGLALALMGFMVLSSNNFHSENILNGKWLGNLLFLLATTAEASFPIFLKPLLKRHSPIVIAFYCLLCASIYMLPFQSLDLIKQLPTLSWSALAGILYLGFGCSFVACLLWLVCLSRATATLVAISWFMQPVLGCVYAALLLKEPMTANIFIGGAFILSALTLLTHKPKEATEQTAWQTTPAQTLFRIQHPLWEQRPLTSFKTKPKRTRAVKTIPPVLLWSHHRLSRRQSHTYH